MIILMQKNIFDAKNMLMQKCFFDARPYAAAAAAAAAAAPAPAAAVFVAGMMKSCNESTR